MFADLDHFKAVNDTYGHLNGGAVLRAVAGVLRAQLREYDVAGRFGGEEFVVLLPRTNLVQARQIAEPVRRAIAAAPVRLTGTGKASATVTISAGVASLESTSTASSLPGLLSGEGGRPEQGPPCARQPGTGTGPQRSEAMNINVRSASILR